MHTNSLTNPSESSLGSTRFLSARPFLACVGESFLSPHAWDPSINQNERSQFINASANPDLRSSAVISSPVNPGGGMEALHETVAGFSIVTLPPKAVTLRLNSSRL